MAIIATTMIESLYETYDMFGISLINKLDCLIHGEESFVKPTKLRRHVQATAVNYTHCISLSRKMRPMLVFRA